MNLLWETEPRYVLQRKLLLTNLAPRRASLFECQQKMIKLILPLKNSLVQAPKVNLKYKILFWEMLKKKRFRNFLKFDFEQQNLALMLADAIFRGIVYSFILHRVEKHIDQLSFNRFCQLFQSKQRQKPINLKKIFVVISHLKLFCA